MAVICNSEPRDFDYYWNLEPSIVYIQGFKYYAPTFIKQARARRIKEIGTKGRTPKGDYIRYCTFDTAGSHTPTTLYIKLSTGTILCDYSRWDTKKENVPEYEMYQVVEEVEKWFEHSNEPRTTTGAIKRKLSPFLDAQTDCYQIEKDNYYTYLEGSFRGGANWTKIGHFPIELHIDYHQLYAYVMSHKMFPKGKPHIVEGYHRGDLNIYAIERGSMCRLKENGFPLIEGIGADGNWFDAGELIQYICDVDLCTLKANYECVNFKIWETLAYERGLDGKTYFKPLIDEVYNGRIKYKGTPKARFYKTLNEVMAGYFERRKYNSDFYTKGFQTGKKGTSVGQYLNPKIGIFITAYARQMLSELLHLFPHDKVIGYDTDCVFFEGTRNEIPFAVKQIMGDLQGQVHEDGYYRNTYHQASKFYWGEDYDTGLMIKKMAGTSLSGYQWVWNQETQEFTREKIK